MNEMEDYPSSLLEQKLCSFNLFNRTWLISSDGYNYYCYITSEDPQICYKIYLRKNFEIFFEVEFIRVYNNWTFNVQWIPKEVKNIFIERILKLIKILYE